MKVCDLKTLLEKYADSTHVVVAVVPNDNPTVIDAKGCKFDIHDVRRDGVGVLNLIATTKACTIDPELRSEYSLQSKQPGR